METRIEDCVTMYFYLKKNILDSDEHLVFDNEEMAINYLVESIALMQKWAIYTVKDTGKKRRLVVRIRDGYNTMHTVTEDGHFEEPKVWALEPRDTGFQRSRNLRTSPEKWDRKTPPTLKPPPVKSNRETPPTLQPPPVYSTNIRNSPSEIELGNSTNYSRNYPSEIQLGNSTNNRNSPSEIELGNSTNYIRNYPSEIQLGSSANYIRISPSGIELGNSTNIRTSLREIQLGNSTNRLSARPGTSNNYRRLSR